MEFLEKQQKSSQNQIKQFNAFQLSDRRDTDSKRKKGNDNAEKSSDHSGFRSLIGSLHRYQ